MDRSKFDAAYFEKSYRDYDAQNPARKLGFYKAQVEAYRSLELPRRIHDTGCGFGRFLRAMGDDWERYGSDVSPHAIERASAACPEALFAVSDAVSIPDSYRDFGVVTAFDVIEHVPDIDAVGEALRRQLLPGGLFLFVVPVYDGLSGPLIRILDRDETHVHKWPRRRWLDWAASRFRLLAWQGIFRYLFPVIGYVHLPTRSLRRQAPAICVACRKQG